MPTIRTEADVDARLLPSPRLARAVILVLTTLVFSLFAQEPEPPEGSPPVLPPELEELLLGGEAEPDPARPASDASTPAYRKALEVLRTRKWSAAQKVLRKVLEDFPDSVHKREIELRSDDNCFLSCDVIHRGGPPERRIDVAVMGDGFTIDADDQARQEQWAKLCLDVLWAEEVFGDYKDYFNYYFVRLASLEEGVDPSLSDEEKAKIIEKNKTRTRKRKIDFSTALDCKAAGPQGQVMADPRLVRKWQRFAAEVEPGADDDDFAIAFARFGRLGMGGGGIANVGRPDKSITVHEFGHAFVGLLDEYAINPGKPWGRIAAPNASLTADPALVPWAHFLAKKIPGVGVFEGGATYQKNVWRPARACAMNSAGNNDFCPVCREATVLRIYGHVNPIDAFAPVTTTEIQTIEGGTSEIVVTPMSPKKKTVSVSFCVAKVAAELSGPDAELRPVAETGDAESPRRRRGRSGFFGLGGRGGSRLSEDRASYEQRVEGEVMSGATQVKTKSGTEHHFGLGRLKAGRYRITVVVKDTTPLVIKDDRHLLEERKTWWVTVAARK